MKYPVFAYSSEMQILLAILSIITSFITMYIISDLILLLCNVTASTKQKALFSFLSGSLMQTGWTYFVFYIGGKAHFTPSFERLITNPNPFSALLFYYVSLKIFKLSEVRSIRIMMYIYLYRYFDKSLKRILILLLFTQNETQYNYMKNGIQMIVSLTLFALMTSILSNFIKKNKKYIRFIDVGFKGKTTELIYYFIVATLVYFISLIIPDYMNNTLIAYICISVFILLLTTLNIFYDLYIYNHQTSSNQMVHISTLSKGMEDFRGIKHDFYNILQTYSGYLEMGLYDELEKYHLSLVDTTMKAGKNLDLVARLEENPALISLLREKAEYAEKNNVKFNVNLKTDLRILFIKPLDLSRVLSCLLDNAIEAASETDDGYVTFTLEKKNEDTKLIIVTNNTKDHVDFDAMQQYGITNKKNHSGVGLHTVRKTISKYENVSFQINYYDYEVSAYIEVTK